MSIKKEITVLVLCLGLILNSASLFVRTSVTAAPPQTDQARQALSEGRKLLKHGKNDKALIQLQTALRLYTAANKPSGIAASHDQLGDLYMRQGQYNVALDHYQKSFEGFVNLKKPDNSAATAGVASVAGSTAAAGVDAAASIADDKFNANLLLGKIGEVNFRLGKIQEAQAAYNRMDVKKPESTASKVGRRFGGLSAIAGSISTGDVAISAPTSALTLALEAKKELSEYRVSIVYSSYKLGLGKIAYVSNDFEGARKHFQEALDAAGSGLGGVAKLGQVRKFRAAARTSLGDTLLRQGKFKDASKFYADAKKGAQDDKRLDLIWPAQRGLGRSLWLQATQEKDPKKQIALREQALANYKESLSTIETLRQGSLRADEARTTFLSTIKDVFDEAASANAEMALATAAGAPLSGKALEYAAEAFRISEQSRSRSLLELLSETGAAITEGVPAELLKRKEENLDRQQAIADVLTGVNVGDEDLKKKPTELDGELEKLQVEFEEIENQIRTASPRYASLTSNRPLTLAEVQQNVLDDQTVLLEYSLLNENSYMWAVTKTSASLYKLPSRTDVDKLAMDLRGQLIPSKLQRRIVGIDIAEANRGLGLATTAPPGETAAFVTASNAVYKTAIEPAASQLGEKRLLIVADGGLNYIPFEVLLKSADAGDFSSLGYLVKTNEIVYAPSASVVGAIKQQRTKATGSAMLIVADPVFNSNDTRFRKPATAAASEGEVRGIGIQSALTDVTGQTTTVPDKVEGLPLARLNGTRTEADQISKLAKSSGGTADVWLDLDANEDNVTTRDITKYRIIHVATHGLLNAERPQFTGVVLSLVGNKNNDGFLRTDEVFNLKLGGPLVMLSACETGLGKEKRGEGVMGLTRAFMYAGAPTVGVSLWSVADKSTADLMSDFYRRLLTSNEASSASALRGAQLAMISGKKYSAPFYWAPFVLVGDWNK